MFMNAWYQRKDMQSFLLFVGEYATHVALFLLSSLSEIRESFDPIWTGKSLKAQLGIGP